MALSFTICVLGGVIAPGLPIPHKSLELFLPGFTWISWRSFALGFVETFAYGVIAAVLFVPLYNFFARRYEGAGPTSVDTTRATERATL
jgi:hypothetical protein